MVDQAAEEEASPTTLHLVVDQMIGSEASRTILHPAAETTIGSEASQRTRRLVAETMIELKAALSNSVIATMRVEVAFQTLMPVAEMGANVAAADSREYPWLLVRGH